MDYFERKRNRLRDFDYSSYGAYFVTICTMDKQCILSHVHRQRDDFTPPQIVLTDVGHVAEREILRFSKIYPAVTVDRYVIMPNHIHMILFIENIENETAAPPSLSRMIQQFKGAVTKQIGRSVWQRSFHDHILRDGEELQRYYTYLSDNPALWALDEYYTEECA